MIGVYLLLKRFSSGHFGNFVYEWDFEQVKFCLYFSHLLFHLLVKLSLFLLELVDGGPCEFKRIITFYDFFINLFQDLLIMV